jgi:NTE family protein
MPTAATRAAGGKTAVIQSGGGAKGAYGLGVMRALFTGASPATRYRPIDPEIFTGTSVGAYNAAIQASQPSVPAVDTLAFLERIWRQSIANTPGGCGNGVFRLRGLPIQELEVSCLLHPVSSMAQLAFDSVYLANQAMIRAVRFASSDLPLPGRLLDTPDISAFFDPVPLRSLIWSTVDLEGLRRSSKELAVATSNWRDGLNRVFWKEEIVAHREVDAIVASTAIPGVFPPVDIHGVPYVDGALTMNTPLKPAIRAGAEELHVIYLDPLSAYAPTSRYTSTFETITRIMSILNAEQIRSDIEKAERINQGLAILRGERRIPEDTGELLRRLPIADEILRRMASEPRRPLVIHRYLPKGSLASGADVLNFSISQIDTLIEQGYQDAVNHDCEASECLVPETAGAGRAPVRDPRPRQAKNEKGLGSDDDHML